MDAFKIIYFLSSACANEAHRADVLLVNTSPFRFSASGLVLPLLQRYMSYLNYRYTSLI